MGIGVWREYGMERNFDRRMAEFENLVLADEVGFDASESDSDGAEGDYDADEGGYDSLVGYLRGVMDDKFVEYYKSVGKVVELVYYETVTKN